MILSKRELDDLKRGKKKLIDVKRHTRVMIMRGEQCIKDRTIEQFAISFTRQLERYGVSSADQRHVRNLIGLLKRHVG